MTIIKHKIMILIPLVIGIMVIFPGIRLFIGDTVKLLAAANIRDVRDYLLGFGVWAPFISLLLMVISVLIPPLPAFVPTFANGLLFGAFWGGVLSWLSALLGATLAFYLARKLGRPVVERVASKESLTWVDGFFARYGAPAVITTRIIPIVSYGVVSYAAGLTSMSFKIYLLGTAIGQTPATILFSYLGEHAAESVRAFLWVFAIIVVLTVLGERFKGKSEVDGDKHKLRK